VNYVASAPLQNATLELRFPLILSLVFMVVAFVLEFVRVTLPFFKRDQEKWAAHDKTVLDEEVRERGIISGNAAIGIFGVQQVDKSAMAKR
jgi:hypothetical protein